MLNFGTIEQNEWNSFWLETILQKGAISMLFSFLSMPCSAPFWSRSSNSWYSQMATLHGTNW